MSLLKFLHELTERVEIHLERIEQLYDNYVTFIAIKEILERFE